MSPSSPFPLFCLPHVVLTEIFNSTTPKEIIYISLCSKRARNIIKYTSMKWKRTNSLSLVLNGLRPTTVMYSEYPLLSVYDYSQVKDLSYIERWNHQNVKIGDTTVVADTCVCTDTCAMVAYWKGELEGIRKCMEYSMEVFNCEVMNFTISSDAKSSDIHWLFQWMASRNTVFSTCSFYSNQVTSEDLNFMFQNIRFDSTVSIYGSPPNNYRRTPSLFLSHPTKRVEVQEGFWLKKIDLLSLNCSEVLLKNTRLSFKDMNCVLREWQVGKACQRMKFGIFYLKNQNPNHLFEGIEVIKVPKETVRMYQLNSKESVAVIEGFDIRRNDGVIATMSFFHETNRTRPFVQMVVWPDFSFEQEN